MSIHEFSPQGFGERLTAGLLRASLKVLLKPSFARAVPVAQQRRRLALLSRSALLPAGTGFEAALLGGVPGEWVRLAERSAAPAPRRGTLLYLHGGAYCVGSAATHRNLTSRLAQSSGMDVFAPDYRLAPEHPFPAAIEDARAVALALLARGPLVIAGDSAGAGLAVATALALRDGGHPGPTALVLFSPWVDMGLKTAPAKPPAGEAMLSVDWAAACAEMCLHDADAMHAWASPLYADLRGLPPVLIQCGTDELLYTEALRFHDALMAAEVPVRCEVTARRWHVFQAHAGVLKSANQALNRVGQFVAAAVDVVLPKAAAVESHEVVVLGAGMSGLCMGIQLKKAGQHDFVILEKSASLGGTWWDNRYPGAHVDVPAPVYCFSFEANPRWQRRFAAAPEIQAYMEHCADSYRVRAHMQFGQSIASASFDEHRGRWRITTDSGRVLDARFFVCSTGPLSQAKWPDIEGLESFAGPKLHSARWDASAPLQGQRIAVIGTGSTASQLVPPLADAASTLYVFQRTANWVLPRLDRRYFALDRLLARLPPYARVVRALWVRFLEFGRRGFEQGTLARKRMTGLAATLLAKQVQDPMLRQKLQPPYPLGCKRIIYSNDFYAALVRPHVQLVTSGIQRITPQGIVTDDGQTHAIDALVCATGFDVSHSLAALTIRGAQGRTLKEAWAAGPEAYRGVTVAGFPNLFLMLGPNTATGHTSTLLYIEPQVQFSIAAMQRVRDANAQQIGVRSDVHVAHNLALQQRLAGSVWSQCRSWYRADDGKVIALWPGYTNEYVRGLLAPDWSEFQLR